MLKTASKSLKIDPVNLAESAMLFFTIGLDQCGSPTILLSMDGLVKHIVPAASRMMSQSPLLRVREGRLYIRRAQDRKALQDSINSAVLARRQARPAEPNLVVLRNREGRAVMGLLLSKLSDMHLPPLILVRIADLLTPSAIAPHWLIRIFELTPAEARVGSALMYGLDLRTIAERDQLALETVRGHLKRAMAKTTARSQAQFVRLLMRVYDSLDIPESLK